MLFGSKTDKIARAIGKKKAAPLIKLAKDADAKVRIAALEGLGKIKSTDGFAILSYSLNDVEPTVRAAAARGLAELGDVHGKAHIVFAMSKETDEKAKEAMHEATTVLKDY